MYEYIVFMQDLASALTFKVCTICADQIFINLLEASLLYWRNNLLSSFRNLRKYNIIITSLIRLL